MSQNASYNFYFHVHDNRELFEQMGKRSLYDHWRVLDCKKARYYIYNYLVDHWYNGPRCFEMGL
jgi:hypothetical protein